MSRFNWPDGSNDFLRAICESPQDDLHRLVFCDWLDERPTYDQAVRDRTEFIRLSISGDFAYMPATSLFSQYGSQWASADLSAVAGWQGVTYDRGFPVAAQYPVDVAYDSLGKLLRCTTIDDLIVTQSWRSINSLIRFREPARRPLRVDQWQEKAMGNGRPLSRLRLCVFGFDVEAMVIEGVGGPKPSVKNMHDTGGIPVPGRSLRVGRVMNLEYREYAFDEI